MKSITFRKINFDEDLPEIIELLKKNLNDNFSEDFFRWKHLENPFGRSHGQIALSNGEIIAVRMFLSWEFLDLDGSIKKALRPVDSVTDINFRGRGIFKILTNIGLNECSDRYDIIYNTPNMYSFPQCIKLGWNRISNVEYYRLGIVNIFRKKYNFKNIHIEQVLPITFETNKFLKTRRSDDYLKWRYKDTSYKIAEFSEGKYVIYLSKHIKGLKTIIVFEVFGKNEDIMIMIRSILFKEKTPFIYYYKNNSFSNQQIFSLKRIQPIIVYKFDKFGIHNLIDFSLGDLEAKL